MKCIETRSHTCQFNSSRPSDTYMCQQTKPSCVQIMVLAPVCRQAIIWTNVGLFGPIGTSFIEIWNKILQFSPRKMQILISAKCRKFVSVLMYLRLNYIYYELHQCKYRNIPEPDKNQPVTGSIWPISVHFWHIMACLSGSHFDVPRGHIVSNFQPTGFPLCDQRLSGSRDTELISNLASMPTLNIAGLFRYHHTNIYKPTYTIYVLDTPV